MLCIKDFRTTTKSYILTLQDSETNELSEKTMTLIVISLMVGLGQDFKCLTILTTENISFR